jgi:hypothetical protein
MRVDDPARRNPTLKTRVIALVPHETRMLEGMETGWTQSIDRLTALLTDL